MTQLLLKQMSHFLRKKLNVFWGSGKEALRNLILAKVFVLRIFENM